MKEALVVMSGLAVIVFVGGELVNNNRDVSTGTRNDVVSCASQLKNNQLKSHYFTLLSREISENEARTLRGECNEAVSRENLETQLEATKVG